MPGRSLLFCDDSIPEVESLYSRLVAILERGAGHNLHTCDGFNSQGAPITNTLELAQFVREKMQAVACEGLIMDLKWFQKLLGYESNLGMDVLELIVNNGVQPPLSLDRIVLLTRYPGDPGVRERFLRLNCPEANIWNKFDVSKNADRFAAIFK